MDNDFDSNNHEHLPKQLRQRYLSLVRCVAPGESRSDFVDDIAYKTGYSSVSALMSFCAIHLFYFAVLFPGWWWKTWH